VQARATPKPHASLRHAQVASRLVPMTVTLWNKIQAKMLPTPSKFHYLFNMRELSKVFQGIILAERDRCACVCVGRLCVASA
jgi:hypothetical protein